MSELLRLLALYYACDNTATARMLTTSEVETCMVRYTSVKAHFAQGSDDNGYRAFKIWERDNHDLVVQLRRGRSLSPGL